MVVAWVIPENLNLLSVLLIFLPILLLFLLQVLMSLHEMFPAVHAAEMAVQRNPRSWDAWQTLGRAQLGLGEIALVG